nr:sigma factor-like helix-turn-helix DNA-binding protein [Fredinandcohnia onubensis]
MREREFETVYTWMRIANQYQERMELYERMAEDENEAARVRELAREEVAYQEKNLKDLLDTVRARNNSFSNVLILKYFEGYTLEEAALTLGLTVSTVKTNHARFTDYIKQRQYQPSRNISPEIKSLFERLNELLKPSYEVCCSHCENVILLPSDVVEKIFRKESKRARAIGRK